MGVGRQEAATKYTGASETSDSANVKRKTGQIVVDMWLSLAALLVGIAASLVVSRHYYRRSFSKELTVYVHGATSLFEGVDKSVQGNISIKYRNRKVHDLSDLQLLIANTGDRAIHDLIAPLTISAPAEAAFLDISVLHIFPQGRLVEATHTERQALIQFPLLNAGEFFLVKLLLRGTVKASDLVFTITGEDLPPHLFPSRLPRDAIDADEPAQGRKVSWRGLVGGAVLSTIALSVAAMIVGNLPTFGACLEQSIPACVKAHPVLLLASIPASFVSLLFLIGGVFGLLAAVSGKNEFTFPRPRYRFRLPASLIPVERTRRPPP